jgi:DNA-binding MarR family transcriptional regulator
MSLKSELGMRKNFDFPAHECILGVYYTASRLRKQAGEGFKNYNITEVQFNVLTLLKHQSGESGGLTQVELSRMMLVNRANITTLIDRMEKANLVMRKPVPDDRRYNIIQLTPHGIDMYAQVAGVYHSKIAEIMDVLDEEEMSLLIGMLSKIRKNLDTIQPV